MSASTAVALQPRVQRADAGALTLLLLATGLSTTGRPGAFALPLFGLTAVAVSVRPRLAGRSQALLASLIGLAPALVILGASHDVLRVTPPLWVSSVVLLVAWWIAAASLGVDVAKRVVGAAAQLDVWARFLAVGGATAFIAGGLLRLLLPGKTTADRLAWAIWEEDNSQIIGIGREILRNGPGGAGLAEQFGTAFINLPLVLTRLLGGTPVSETDARLQAITLFTVSTIVAIVLAGLAMMFLAALPHHVHPSRFDAIPKLTTILAGGLTSGAAALISLSVLVVLPMRTGFLTFVWGLTLIILGASLVAVTPSQASPASRAVLVAHLVSVLILLLSSWPFIAPALVPLFLVPILWIRWGEVRSAIRRKRGPWSAAGVVALIAIGATTYWFSQWGPVAEVLSYGLGILLVVASGIQADALITGAAFVSSLAGVALITLLGVRKSRLAPALSLAGPVASSGMLYLALVTAAAVLTGGELNYSGEKLFYGVVTLALVLGLVTIASLSTRLGLPGTLVALAAIVLTHQLSPTASLHAEWWDRTAFVAQPHVEATVRAIRMTSPDLPIRCLPAPGTAVTGTTQWAAYTCARWIEDAFNEDRFHGHRNDLLNAQGETFDETIEKILAESPNSYMFAYRFTMGAGWFGWTGG